VKETDMAANQGLTHAVESTNLADLLERILDKGIVIAGDIHVKLVNVELLSIQLRLVICSVDKARELGLDWWNHDARLSRDAAAQGSALAVFGERLSLIEQKLGNSAELSAGEKVLAS
jgi:hypothetical protein